MGHDCMIEYYGVYYTMSNDKAVAWLYCRRTCNQTLSHAISIHVHTFTAILLFCAMVLQAHIMLLCIRDVCSSEWFIRFCYYTAVTLMWLSHIPSISHSCVSCMCFYTMFLPLNRFRVFCTCVYVTVIEEELIGFRGNL